MAKASDKNTPPANAADGAETPAHGKGRPTPSRREREAANQRPLVSNDRREARKKLSAERERARIGMANGEERYLQPRDKGPQRRWVRDYVDARFSFGEFLIPVMFAVIILTFIDSETTQLVAIIALWGFFIIAVLDGFVLGWLVRRGVAKKFGENNVQNGHRWYAAMRAMQMRIMRLPKPQVKRGQFPH